MSVNWCQSGLCPVCEGAAREGAARRPATATDALSDDAEFAELLENARRLRPIPVSPSSNETWEDSSRDRWGAPSRNPLLARTWGGGNCLRGCIASLLGCDIERVPHPDLDYHEQPRGYLERYSKRLAKETGYRLDRFPRHACPPRNPNQLWIAGIRMDGPADHVVVARGHYVVHDPTDLFSGLLPLDRIIDGMLVVPTKRVVPVVGRWGKGYAVVSA
jgi:hypothetical protein